MTKHKRLTIAVITTGLVSEIAFAHPSQSTWTQHASEHLWVGVGGAVLIVMLLRVGSRWSQ